MIVFAIVVVVLLLYLGFAKMEARADTKAAPRQDMMVCAKHGAFPKSAALDLGQGELDVQKEDGRTVREAFLYCPMCMEDRFKEAQKKN